MITPDPTLKANEITLPLFLYQSLICKNMCDPIKNTWVLVNRMPSLFPENLTAHKIARVTTESTIGLPMEVILGLNADFDGDEVNVYYPKETASQLELASIMNPETNLFSMTMANRCKLQPSRDILQMFYILTNNQKMFPEYFKKLNILLAGYLGLSKNLNEILFLVSIEKGNQICFNIIAELSKLYIEFSNHFHLSVCLQDLMIIKNELKKLNDPVAIEEKILSNKGISLLLNSKVTPDHIEQCCLSLGLQFWPSFLASSDIVCNKSIEGNFLEGLNPFEQLVHSQSSFSNMISSSKDVWIPGYKQKKLCHFLTDCKVHKDSSVRENKEIINTNPLEYTYPEHVVSDFVLAQIIDYCNMNK